jgi:hypothetical protein
MSHFQQQALSSFELGKIIAAAEAKSASAKEERLQSAWRVVAEFWRSVLDDDRPGEAGSQHLT